MDFFIAKGVNQPFLLQLRVLSVCFENGLSRLLFPPLDLPVVP